MVLKTSIHSVRGSSRSKDVTGLVQLSHKALCVVQGVLRDYKNYVLPAGFCLEENCVVERHVLHTLLYYTCRSIY